MGPGTGMAGDHVPAVSEMPVCPQHPCIKTTLAESNPLPPCVPVVRKKQSPTFDIPVVAKGKP
jgi:hypothetical protein